MSSMAGEVQTTHYGDPRIVQRVKLWSARHRPAPLRATRCLSGKHNPPAAKAFSCMGAVFAGGPCTRCGDEEARVVCWIGNAWDFPDVANHYETDEGGVEITVSSLALSLVLNSLGFTYIGDFWV